MFTVADIYEDAQNIVGTCDDATLFRRLTEAIELLANKGDFDPLLGVMDIAVQHDRCIALPREVETPLAVNISGRPSIGKDFLFSFHVNGPGDQCGPVCGWTWQDGGESPVYRELTTPSRLIAFVDKEEDAGKELWAYGYDEANNWIRSLENDEWIDGWRVPTIFGYAVPDTTSPKFSRVVRVRREQTVGPMRLSSYDNSLTTGTLIGLYQFDETEPMYRKIKLSQSCVWARIAFRRRTFKITSLLDLIPLHSSASVLMMLRAVKAYGPDNDLATGAGCEATAVRWLTEEQETRQPPVAFPIQINPNNSLHDAWDDMD